MTTDALPQMLDKCALQLGRLTHQQRLARHGHTQHEGLWEKIAAHLSDSCSVGSCRQNQCAHRKCGLLGRTKLQQIFTWSCVMIIRSASKLTMMALSLTKRAIGYGMRRDGSSVLQLTPEHLHHAD